MKKNRALMVLVVSTLLLAGCVAVGDFVWLDLNGNGIQDIGEPGVEGVSVALRDVWDDTIVDTDITDTSGSYSLSRISLGNSGYFIEFDLPSGYEFTLANQGSDDELDSDANPVTGRTLQFGAGDSGPGYDAGLIEEVTTEEEPEPEEPGPAFATITGYAWVDANHNGLQDENESPLADVGVRLFVDGDDDAPIQQTQTDSQGLYEFNGVEVGLDYYIAFVPPTEYLITLMDQGGDDGIDSDADEETEQTEVFTVTEVGVVLDAGVYVPAAASICYGPTAEDFPAGISPMSGLEVSDPTYLAYRPIFLSISIFPASVRPPAIATAPQIYVIYIGDGETRLMAAFYGEFPEANFTPDEGESEGEDRPEDAELLVGDWVWFDNNGDGLQDSNEPGVPDIPVTLYINGSTYAQTVTDGLGYYYFDYTGVEPDDTLQIFFDVFSVHPDFYFVTRDVGDDDEIDSDAGSLGYTSIYNLADGVLADFDLSVDAGVRQALEIEALRSGRVAYQHVQGHYCGCLVTAGADPTVAAQINICASAFGEGGDIGSAGLDVTRLQAIAEQSSEDACGGADLAANLFCTDPPTNGAAGNELWMEYSYFNIKHFVYNGQGAYNWYINGTSEATQQEFTLMRDALTDEPLTFENVVVMQVDHSQDNAAGTIFSLNMDFASGKAYYFRNGQMFEGTWTTLASESYDPNSEMLPPVRFLDENGNPFSFAPGQIWINTVNTGDNVRPGDGAGVWEVDFDAPAYSP